jgi:hypothetical protein
METNKVHFYGKLTIEYKDRVTELSNLILRAGYKALLTGLVTGDTQISPEYYAFGTGLSAPDIDNTSLENEVLFKITNKNILDNGMRARFETLLDLETLADGKIYSEAGLYSSNGSDKKLLSRVLLDTPIKKIQGEQLNMRWDYHAHISSGSGVWYNIEDFHSSTKFYTKIKPGYYPFGTVINEGLLTSFNGGSYVLKYLDLTNQEITYPLTLTKDTTVLPIFGAHSKDFIPVISSESMDIPRMLPAIYASGMTGGPSGASVYFGNKGGSSITYDNGNNTNLTASGNINITGSEYYINIKTY